MLRNRGPQVTQVCEAMIVYSDHGRTFRLPIDWITLQLQELKNVGEVLLLVADPQILESRSPATALDLGLINKFALSAKVVLVQSTAELSAIFSELCTIQNDSDKDGYSSNSRLLCVFGVFEYFTRSYEQELIRQTSNLDTFINYPATSIDARQVRDICYMLHTIDRYCGYKVLVNDSCEYDRNAYSDHVPYIWKRMIPLNLGEADILADSLRNHDLVVLSAILEKWIQL